MPCSGVMVFHPSMFLVDLSLILHPVRLVRWDSTPSLGCSSQNSNSGPFSIQRSTDWVIRRPNIFIPLCSLSNCLKFPFNLHPCSHTHTQILFTNTLFIIHCLNPSMSLYRQAIFAPTYLHSPGVLLFSFTRISEMYK